MSSRSLPGGLSRLLRITGNAREVEFPEIVSDGRAPSMAVRPPSSSRQLRPRLPGAGRVLAAYTLSVVVVGALLVVSYGSGSDNLWPLMMVPVLAVAFYYPRYVYLLMLAGYALGSFSVIGLVSENKIEKLAITVPFLVSVGLASEVIYRLATWREQARAALRQSEQRFRALSASAPIGIFQTDAQGMCTYVNAHYLAVSGLTLEQSLGPGWQSIIHPEDRSAFLEHWATTPTISHDLSHNYRILTADGQTRWVNVTAAPLTSPAGKFMGYVGTLEDVTDRKQAAEALQKANDELESRVEQRTVELKLAIQELEQEIAERTHAEEALRESDARFRAAIDGSMDSFVILRSVRDETGRIVDFEYVDVNNRAEEMASKKSDELIGKRVFELFPVARAQGFFERYVQVVESGEALEEEIPVSVPEFASSWLHHQIIPLADGIAITTRDISERKLAEAQLQEYANSQNLLLNQVMTAQEAERRRLSMDIHDGPLQSLGVSLIALDRAIRRRERGEHELVDQELRHLRDTLASTVEEVRAVLADLNLEILVNYGLEVALRNHIERFSDVTGLEVTLRNSLEMQLPPDIELLMYRLAQESLANIRKHARAHKVIMSLDIVGSDLQMRITDDGQGLDVEAAFRQSRSGDTLGQKLGLRSMRQRIQSVRGDLAITSTPGKGTTLEFSCPVPFAEEP